MSSKGSRLNRYDAPFKARLTLALLQGKARVAEFAHSHVVQQEVLHRWRHKELQTIQLLVRVQQSHTEELRKEILHVRRELKKAQLEQVFFAKAFGKLDLPDAKR